MDRFLRRGAPKPWANPLCMVNPWWKAMYALASPLGKPATQATTTANSLEMPSDAFQMSSREPEKGRAASKASSRNTPLRYQASSDLEPSKSPNMSSRAHERTHGAKCRNLILAQHL